MLESSNKNVERVTNYNYVYAVKTIAGKSLFHDNLCKIKKIYMHTLEENALRKICIRISPELDAPVSVLRCFLDCKIRSAEILSVSSFIDQ